MAFSGGGDNLNFRERLGSAEGALAVPTKMVRWLGNGHKVTGKVGQK